MQIRELIDRVTSRTEVEGGVYIPVIDIQSNYLTGESFIFYKGKPVYSCRTSDADKSLLINLECAIVNGILYMYKHLEREENKVSEQAPVVE